MTNGLVVMTPSSIAYSGTSASINADGSVVFSACTSLSLNGVFTSDYDNYMVAIRGVSNTALNALVYRLRASGTDNSTASSYTRQYVLASSTSVSAARDSANQGQSMALDTLESGQTFYLFGPYLAQPTAIRTVAADSNSDARVLDYAVTHNQSTAYDGITVYPASGNMTGLLTVFGFNQ